MYFEYWKAQDGNWYWHLKGANHEIVAQGEGYVTKHGVEHAITLVKSCAAAPVYNLTPNT